jgi:hypothetical protein
MQAALSETQALSLAILVRPLFAWQELRDSKGKDYHVGHASQ